MITYAVTGGVGMGKSVVAAQLVRWGISVVDTDQLARALVEPGQPALGEIAGAFGDQMLDVAGTLRRDRLAEVVFSDATARRRLEAILHPRIRLAWHAQIDAWRKARLSKAAVIIPLLFEIRAESEVDCTVCVACSAPTQRLRLRARGWDETEIARRVTAQWPVEEKMRHADRVLWNEGSLHLVADQVARIFEVSASTSRAERD